MHDTAVPYGEWTQTEKNIKRFAEKLSPRNLEIVEVDSRHRGQITLEYEAPFGDGQQKQLRQFDKTVTGGDESRVTVIKRETGEEDAEYVGKFYRITVPADAETETRLRSAIVKHIRERTIKGLGGILEQTERELKELLGPSQGKVATKNIMNAVLSHGPKARDGR